MEFIFSEDRQDSTYKCQIIVKGFNGVTLGQAADIDWNVSGIQDREGKIRVAIADTFKRFAEALDKENKKYNIQYAR